MAPRRLCTVCKVIGPYVKTPVLLNSTFGNIPNQ